MRSGKRRMTPRSNQGQPWKGWIFWSGLQERKRGFWIDSRQSFLNPEAVSNSTQCFALGWDSAPSPWPDSNLATAAGAAAIWSVASKEHLGRLYNSGQKILTSTWHWIFTMVLLLILASTSLLLQSTTAVPLTDKDGKVTLSNIHDPSIMELIPGVAMWQPILPKAGAPWVAEGVRRQNHISNLSLCRWSTFSFSYLILQASFFQSENLPLTKDTDPLLWKMAPFSSQSIELLLFSSYKIPSSD